MHLLNTLLGTTGGRSHSKKGKYILSLRCCLMTFLSFYSGLQLVYCVDELQRFCLVVKRDVRPSTGIDGKWLLKEAHDYFLSICNTPFLHNYRVIISQLIFRIFIRGVVSQEFWFFINHISTSAHSYS